MKLKREVFIDGFKIHSEFFYGPSVIIGTSTNHKPLEMDGVYYFRAPGCERIICLKDSIISEIVTDPAKEVDTKAGPTISSPAHGSVLQSKEGGVYLDKETKGQLDRIEAMLVEAIAEKTCKCGL